jgi:hypothetical protein
MKHFAILLRAWAYSIAATVVVGSLYTSSTLSADGPQITIKAKASAFVPISILLLVAIILCLIAAANWTRGRRNDGGQDTSGKSRARSLFDSLMTLFVTLAISMICPFMLITMNSVDEPTLRTVQKGALLVSSIIATLVYLANPTKYPTFNDKLALFTGVSLGPPTVISFLV